MSERFQPLLTNLRVHLAAESVSDTAEIELDDTNGRIALPRASAFMAIALGWRSSGIAPVFEGTVDDLRSRGTRGGGSTLAITAKSADTTGKGKQAQQKHWDDKSLGDVMQEAGRLAGYSVRVDPSLASIKRAWWGMQAESYFHFGHRIARETGGIFKVFGKTAILAKRNGGLSLGGAVLSSVTAESGRNLITWDKGHELPNGHRRFGAATGYRCSSRSFGGVDRHVAQRPPQFRDHKPRSRWALCRGAHANDPASPTGSRSFPPGAELL